MKILTEYLQMAINEVASRLPGSKRNSVSFTHEGDSYRISIQGKSLMAPGYRRWRCYRQGFEPRLAEVARRYGLSGIEPTSEDDWVVDVGGYMGEWSLYMLNKGFNVLAIEPDPIAAKCLRYNLETNGRKDRKWLHDPRVALDECREVSFFSEPINADGSIFPSGTGKAKEICMQGERLDNIIADRIGDRIIRGIKMDAEGAEPEVLAGATRTLECCQLIGIDAGAERIGEKTVNSCVSLLRQAGFQIINGEGSGDGSMVIAEPGPDHPLSKAG